MLIETVFLTNSQTMLSKCWVWREVRRRLVSWLVMSARHLVGWFLVLQWRRVHMRGQHGPAHWSRTQQTNYFWMTKIEQRRHSYFILSIDVYLYFKSLSFSKRCLEMWLERHLKTILILFTITQQLPVIHQSTDTFRKPLRTFIVLCNYCF